MPKRNKIQERTPEDIKRYKERSFRRAYAASRFRDWAQSEDDKGPLGYESLFDFFIQEAQQYGLRKVEYDHFGMFLYGIEREQGNWKRKYGFIVTDQVLADALYVAMDKGLDGSNLFKYAHGVIRSRAENCTEPEIIIIRKNGLMFSPAL